MRDTVAEVLAEVGLAHDDELGRALSSLRTLCPPEAPEPSGALAELLAHGLTGGGSAGSTRAGKRAVDAAAGKLLPRQAAVVPFPVRKRHRGAAISAAVIAGVGLSASGVAALGGVDYSADAPSRGVRAVEAPGPSGSAGAAPDSPGSAVVRQAQALAAAVEQDLGAPPAAQAAVAEGRTAADGRTTGADDDGGSAVLQVASTVAAKPAPRHRADPAPSRARHLATDAQAMAESFKGARSFAGAAAAMANAAQKASSFPHETAAPRPLGHQAHGRELAAAAS